VAVFFLISVAISTKLRY